MHVLKSCDLRKITVGHVHPAKIQNDQIICAIWSHSLLRNCSLDIQDILRQKVKTAPTQEDLLRRSILWQFWDNFSFSIKTCRPRWLSWMHRPTGDQEVAGSTPAGVGNILSWRLIMKYFRRSFSPFRWFKKGSCQFLVKECAQYW